MLKKILIVLVISIHSMVSAQSENIQTIHLNCIDTPLESAIREIQRQTNIEFIYDTRLIMNQTVTCRIENVPVREAITLLLKQTPISFQIFPPNSIVFYEDKTSSQKIAGVVVDRLSQEELPQANITLKNSERGTATDESGYFKLENMRTELCTLMVCYMGYQPLEILVDNSNVDPVKVEMDQNPVAVPPLEILGSRVSDMPIINRYGQIRLFPVEIKSLSSPADRDILHTLQTAPGTKNIFDHLDGLYVQGGTPDQNLVMFDGIPVFRAEHLWGYLHVFNPRAVKQIEFLQAGFPSRYGDKLSSVIVMEGDTGNMDRSKFGIGADFFSAGAYLQIPIRSRWRCAFSLRQSFREIGLRDMYYNIEDYLFLLKRRYRADLDHKHMFRFYDATGKIEYAFSADSKLSFTMFTTYDNIDITTKLSENREKIEGVRFEKWTNTGLGIHWNKTWASKNKLNLYVTQASYGNEYLYQYRLTAHRWQVLPDSTIVDLYYDIPVEEFDQFQIDQFNCKCEYAFHVRSFYQIETGTNISYTTIRHQLPNEHYYTIERGSAIEDKYHLSIDIPADSKTWKYVLYLENRLKLWKHIEAIAGCRTLYYHPLKTTTLDPRLILSVRWGYFTLNAKWGHYHQFLHRMSVRAGDFNPMRTSYYWALSDERLKPEFAEHVSFGIAFDRNAYLLKIHLYQKKSKNLLFLIPTIYSDAYLYSSAMHEAIHSTSDMIYIDRGASTSRGIEFLLQKKYGAISGGLTYQIGKSEYQFQTINQGHLFLAEYDRTHEINWVTQFAWRNWMLSLSTIFATGTPFSTAEHTVFGSPIEHDFYAYCDRSVINNERLPSYNRFDIKLSHRIRIFSLCELEYGCTLLNLFNQTNVIDRYYQNAEDMKNNQVTDITEPGRTLFIFCNLSH